MTTSPTSGIDNGPGISFPVIGDGTPATSHGEMYVSLSDKTTRDGEKIIRFSLPDRFGTPGAMIDLSATDAVTFVMALSSFLKVSTMEEAQEFVDFVEAGMALFDAIVEDSDGE